MLNPLVPGEPSVAECLEKTTPRYTFTITDDELNPLPAASLTTLTLTLYVINADGTVTILNSRNAQNVLNANNVTISAQGLGVWSVQVLDTTMVVATLPFETRIALWQWTWSAGAKAGKHELNLVVKNLSQVS